MPLVAVHTIMKTRNIIFLIIIVIAVRIDDNATAILTAVIAFVWYIIEGYIEDYKLKRPEIYETDEYASNYLEKKNKIPDTYDTWGDKFSRIINDLGLFFYGFIMISFIIMIFILFIKFILNILKWIS